MFGLCLDDQSTLSFTRQLCDQLRKLIVNNEVRGGMKLPPTRLLAAELKISRNVIIEVYEQLAAEGYLEGKIGSGTFVAKDVYQKRQALTAGHAQRIEPKRAKVHQNLIDFSGGIPDLRLFPRKVWGRYFKETMETIETGQLNYGDIRGDSALIETLREYVFRIKGIRCYKDQIIIVSGSSEAFLLIAAVFQHRVNSIFVEEPTVSFTRDVFLQMNYELVPIDVDQAGMQIDKLESSQEAKLILLTPSHQFPTGSILSAQRRYQAVTHAEKTESYLIEDDYDSEFRLKGVPIPPLHLIAPERVFYVGTFSKTLFPGMRLGFMIVPEHFAEQICLVKKRLNRHTATIEQRALAAMIADGYMERHIYTMKGIYRRRRAHLVNCLQTHFGKEIDILGDDAGMHLQVQFKVNPHGTINWAQAVEYGIVVNSLEEYCLVKGKHNDRIVLGYGDLMPEEIEKGIMNLSLFLRHQLS